MPRTAGFANVFPRSWTPIFVTFIYLFFVVRRFGILHELSFCLHTALSSKSRHLFTFVFFFSFEYRLTCIITVPRLHVVYENYYCSDRQHESEQNVVLICCRWPKVKRSTRLIELKNPESALSSVPPSDTAIVAYLRIFHRSWVQIVFRTRILGVFVPSPRAHTYQLPFIK